MIVKDAQASGEVVRLSGGVDNNLTAVLCVNVLGINRVLDVSIPLDFTLKEDVEDARKLAEQLGVDTRFVDKVFVLGSGDLGLDQNNSG